MVLLGARFARLTRLASLAGVSLVRPAPWHPRTLCLRVSLASPASTFEPRLRFEDVAGAFLQPSCVSACRPTPFLRSLEDGWAAVVQA